MKLTVNQAKKLGRLIANARMKKGMAQAALVSELGVADGWLAGIEAGRFLDPSGERLARLADSLGIELSAIERIARGSVAEGLPEVRTYFRAKYDLTPEQIQRIERYIERVRKEAA